MPDFAILPVVLQAAMCGLTPPASMSAMHQQTLCVAATHEEAPETEHDYLDLLVHAVTGAPNEFSKSEQVSFFESAPWRQPEFACDFTPKIRVQKRALGHTAYQTPSKLRGR